jgi:DNA-binding CsgD family transcriptional regulator/PAS domain-containing protein
VIAEIEDELATVRVDGGRTVAQVLPRIREVLGIEAVCVYTIGEGVTGWDLPRFEHAGFPARFHRVFSSFLSEAPRRYGVFNPARPEPAQRNRLIEAHKLVDMRQPDHALVFDRVFTPCGLGEHRHLRILLCEGASLLGWFGMLSREPFTARERRLLRGLARPMHHRLLAERRLARDHLAAAAFDALLEAIPPPAFLIDARGAVRETNAAARRLLERRDREIRAALVDALGGLPTSVPVYLTRVHDRGMAMHWLAVVDVDRAEARVSAAAERYHFTPREAETLLWVVRGATNQRIAAELGCSERTVEAHIANLFTKADVASRTELVARVLT